jgi:hydroxymethylpyrimidine pyrophosphatase-like HAD family hydrolase
MQVFDVSLPAIFENGAGLAWRLPYEARLYPKVQEGLEELHSFKRILEEQDDLVIQMGKVASLTVFSRKGRLSLESLFERVCNLKDAHRAHLLLDPAQDCINVLVPGVDKGTGLKWLAEELDIELSQIAGIGDSPGDIVWLRRCTISCAPANASPAVKKNVSWVSPYTDIRATLEFYGHLIQHNRKLLNIDAVPKDESVA